MICIYCLQTKTSITNSRGHKKQPTTWRRHYCTRCNRSFSTYETPDFSFIRVTSTTTRQSSAFYIGKLAYSIALSFAHNEDQAQHASLELAFTVVNNLISQKKHNITNNELKTATHTILERFDKKAAIQYAARHDLL